MLWLLVRKVVQSSSFEASYMIDDRLSWYLLLITHVGVQDKLAGLSV
jgi:hypothetical protein